MFPTLFRFPKTTTQWKTQRTVSFLQVKTLKVNLPVRKNCLPYYMKTTFYGSHENPILELKPTMVIQLAKRYACWTVLYIWFLYFPGVHSKKQQASIHLLSYHRDTFYICSKPGRSHLSILMSKGNYWALYMFCNECLSGNFVEVRKNEQVNIYNYIYGSDTSNFNCFWLNFSLVTGRIQIKLLVTDTVLIPYCFSPCTTCN